MTGTIKGHHGLEFKYGAALTGVWAYRQEHLETTHALKRAAGAVPRNRARARECPPAPRFTMTVLEKEPGTLVCQGTFTDDPALWGHGAAPARARGRLEPAEPAEAPLFFHDSPGVPPPRAGKDRRDSFVVTVGPDGRTRAGRVRSGREFPPPA